MKQIIKTKYGNARINSSGYYIISTCGEGNFEKYLHRLIYEDHYGEIPDGYMVHHKNENKLDNRIDNLELMSHEEHSAYHSKGKQYWLGRKHSEETKEKIRQSHIKKYATIIKRGKDIYGRQKFSIRHNEICIKHSISIPKLINWFTKEYPTTILKINGVFK